MYFINKDNFITCGPTHKKITFTRFKKLNQYLHLNDEEHKINNDPLYKVRSAIDITDKFVQFFQAGQDIAVDEEMIGYK